MGKDHTAYPGCYPYQASGGEIQRINLFRVLLLEPEAAVLDEATSMLDMSVQAQILMVSQPQIGNDFRTEKQFLWRMSWSIWKSLTCQIYTSWIDKRMEKCYPN